MDAREFQRIKARSTTRYGARTDRMTLIAEVSRLQHALAVAVETLDGPGLTVMDQRRLRERLRSLGVN